MFIENLSTKQLENLLSKLYKTNVIVKNIEPTHNEKLTNFQGLNYFIPYGEIDGINITFHISTENKQSFNNKIRLNDFNYDEKKDNLTKLNISKENYTKLLSEQLKVIDKKLYIKYINNNEFIDSKVEEF